MNSEQNLDIFRVLAHLHEPREFCIEMELQEGFVRHLEALGFKVTNMLACNGLVHIVAVINSH